MSRCGAEFQSMIDYCKSRGISKILVESLRDIGKTADKVNRTVDVLCAHGFEVETADSGQIFAAKNEEALPEKDEGQGFTIGGLT